MYLSKIRLNQSPQARRALLEALKDGAYGSHQLLWRLFDDNERHFLYRQEQGDGYQAPSGEPLFYVLSRTPPRDHAGIFEIHIKAFSPRLNPGDRLAFRLRVNPTVCRDGKRHDVLMDAQMGWLREQLDGQGLDKDGQKGELRMRLLDFATDVELAGWREIIHQGRHRQALERPLGRSETLDLALKSQAERALADWWQQRLPGLGAEEAPGGALSVAGYQRHSIPKKHRLAAFSSVELAGEIHIQAPDTLLEHLCNGIGRAKAFGCGLMMIRRI
ncbi:type I-E CRISPR-associated protein Cas6/Cse3/CasE [Gallaecimonas sp. GXIMD4217]|uniref:type I-E CRISPR-associated protein Cas6/Cse3/CasE n=1 Tax=Gallaecimonas sp. GXIMD4217 TaxID=3131927 RepID=UPI00311B4088